MNLTLFLLVFIVSFTAVRIGAIAFQLTGLEWSLAKFQALSCFTATGFTTKEAELITTHPQRRRIASVLIVLGHAGLVTMVATLANSLQAQQILETKLIKALVPFDMPTFLTQLINLVVLIAAVYLVYKIFTNTKVANKLTNMLRRRIIKRQIIKPVRYEELLVATGGFGVSKIDVCEGSPIIDKTILDSQLKKQDIMVLAIETGDKTIPNPSPHTKFNLGDKLICFGKLENIRNTISLQPKD